MGMKYLFHDLATITLVESATGTCCIGGWMVPRAILDALEKIKIC
jgi:hypothetical protein